MIINERARRATILRYQKKDNPIKKIEIELVYLLDGPNYVSGQVIKRGYHISVQPVEKDEHFITFTGFTGLRMFYRPATRYSATTLHELADKVLAEKLFVPVLNQVLSKNNINLEEYELEAL